MWQTRPLGNVCEIIGGGTPSKRNAAFYGGPIPWATVRDMRSDLISKTEHTITEDAVRDSSTNIIPAHNVIIATRVGLGKVCFVEQETAINQDLRGVVPKDRNKLDVHFLFWWLKSIASLIVNEGTGATVQGVKLPFVKSLQIPLPPLAEQKRIVATLDEAFEGIDRAVVNTEKNLANTRELFESYLNSIFARNDRESNRVPVSEVCDSIVDCLNRTAPKVEGPTEYKMMRTTNVRYGRINLAKVNFVTEETFRIWTRRQVPKMGDVILTREAPMGEVGMIDCTDQVFLGQRLVSYRADPAKMRNRFLYYALRSADVQGQIRNMASGSTVQHMRVPDSKTLKIFCPSIEMQENFVAKLDSISEMCSSLLEAYERKLNALTEIEQSILQKAFAGELTQIEAQAISTTSDAVAADTKSPEFAANVIAFIQTRHVGKKQQMTFGRVKEQKALQGVESLGGIDMGREPRKDAAGPNDFQHMLGAEAWAKTARFFEFVKQGEGYKFKKLARYDEMTARGKTSIEGYRPALERVAELIAPMNSRQAEVFFTVHAAWNNLVLDRAEITDEAILFEARENWHPDKLKIPVSEFRKAIKQIRKEGLVPDGSAKRVGDGQGSLL